MKTLRRVWKAGGRQSIGIGLLTLLAAFLRFYLIGNKTVWLDEAFSIWLARHPLWEMWGWLVRIDQHPPLYYTLLHGWIGLFGDLQGPVRGLSALCSTLAVPVFYMAVRRLIDQPTALIAAFILAISPFHIRFAQEARMYGLLTLAVAGALYCVAVILQERDARRRVWWGLAICQAAVMLTHNTAAVYFPLALNLALWGSIFNAEAQRRKGGEESHLSETPDRFADRDHEYFERSDAANLSGVDFVKRWLTFQGVALLLWSPWAWPFVVQSAGVDRQFWIWPPTAGMIWDTFRNFNFAFLPGNLPFQAGWMALYGGLVLLGVWQLRRSSALWLLGSLLVIPIAIALLVSLRRPIFFDRTLIWLTLPYYALIATGVRTACSVRRPLSLLIQTGLLFTILVLSGLSLNGYYFWFEKEGWDKAATYIAENARTGDLIVFNATWVQIPFDYYYRHYGTDTELRGLPVDLFDRGVLEPQMKPGDIPYLHELVDSRQRLWLVYSHDWYTDSTQIIPREIGRSLREVERKRFIGLQVIRYEAR